MAPIPPLSSPRVVIYFQTHFHPDGSPISILPLVTQPGIRVSHVNVAAIHLNDPPGTITLNDDTPSHPRFHTLWAELRVLQASGVAVMGMLGGAARGSFARLDGGDDDDGAGFESHYAPLRDLVRERALDGLDLDVEEQMSLAGVVRLVDRLKRDFGEGFLVTFAPVAAALISDDPRHNLSGFGYEALEVMRGSKISWYNCQFYCGWGDASTANHYEMIVARGYAPQKIVMGLITNGNNGAGWVPHGTMAGVLSYLKARYPTFGGVMGWEYFNSLPGSAARPWEWAAFMTDQLRSLKANVPATATALSTVGDDPAKKSVMSASNAHSAANFMLADGNVTEGNDAPLPSSFNYYTDGSDTDF